MEISETNFFDTLTIHNDQMPYVKHVLDPLYVFFTPFGCLDAAGGLPKDWLLMDSLCSLPLRGALPIGNRILFIRGGGMCVLF